MYKPSFQQKPRALRFNHFTRKGYALFSVLGKEVMIGVLSVATLLAAAPCLAQGSLSLPQQYVPTASDTVNVGEAEVTALRAATRLADMPALQAKRLSRSDLEQAGVTSVNDALKLVAGIDVRQRGPMGTQTDISIDGGTADQVAFFLNGFPLQNAQTGHNAADFPVNLSDIAFIEIVEGAASALFGTGAFSGAVNIVTQRPLSSSPNLTVNLQGGSYGTFLSELRGAGALANPSLGTSLSASYRRSDGATTNSDLRGGKFFWQGAWNATDFALDAMAGATLSDFGANTFYSAAYPDQWEATKRIFVGLRGRSKGRVNLLPEFSWTRNIDHFQLIRHTNTAENFNLADNYDAALRATAALRTGTVSQFLALSAEMRFEELRSSNLGRAVDTAQWQRVAGQDAIFYTKRISRENISFTLSDELTWRNLKVDARLLLQHNSLFGRGFSLYPALHLKWTPRPGWALYASYNKALRLPTFTDLYYKSPTQEGNTSLRSEKNNALRIGASYTRMGFNLSARLFYSRATDMIDWAMYAPDDVFHATQFSLDNYGASLDANISLQQLLGSRQPIETLKLQYAFLYQHRRGDLSHIYKSNYALEYLPHKLTASLSHRIVSRLGATWSLRLWQREGNYLLYADGKSTGELRPYGTHAVLDCKLTWRAKHWTAFADLQNLTATRYYDIANVPQPRFFALFGIEVRL